MSGDSLVVSGHFCWGRVGMKKERKERKKERKKRLIWESKG